MKISNRTGLLAVAGVIAVLSACAPPAENGGGSESETSPADASAGNAVDAGSAPSTNLTMSETGWMTVGEDGAVYTTFFDAGGTYRDFRNGSPMLEGTWERRENGRLCFTPTATDRTGACWTTGELAEDGTMRITNSQGREVEIKRVTYLAPEAAEEGADEADGASGS